MSQQSANQNQNQNPTPVPVAPGLGQGNPPVRATPSPDPSLTDYDMDVVETGDKIHFVFEDGDMDDTVTIGDVDRSGPVWHFEFVYDTGLVATDVLNFPKELLADGSYEVELLDWSGEGGGN